MVVASRRQTAAFAAVTALTLLATAGCAARTATLVQQSPGKTGATSKPSSGADLQPSSSARMVCSAEIRGDVATLLALRTSAAGVSTWVDHVYTCTYQLPGGPLVLSVDDAPNRASAETYFATMIQHLASPTPLSGLSALGLPAYETANGVVAFLKDDKTLEIDASGLRGPLGPSSETATALAYTVASDVLGCWTGG